jgi:hypothetical protein
MEHRARIKAGSQPRPPPSAWQPTANADRSLSQLAYRYLKACEVGRRDREKALAENAFSKTLIQLFYESPFSDKHFVALF